MQTCLEIDLGATTLRYHRGGPEIPRRDRPPVLLLHPWFGCWQFWTPTVELLDGVRSYAVDWYSLSRGDWTACSSPHGLATAVLTLLDRLDLERVDVIGNSVGGIVAQVIASEHPERVRRLVLVGTGARTAGVHSRFADLVDRWVGGSVGDREPLAGAIVDALVARDLPVSWREVYVEAVRRADGDFLAAVLQSCRALDLRARLGAITAPTLVLRGEHDTARTRQHSDELVAGIRGARQIELTGCGHSPMIDDPTGFARLTEEHLGEAGSTQ